MENAKAVYESFLKGWNSSESIDCDNEPYRSGVSCGRRLVNSRDPLYGERLEGFIVGVTSRWVALSEVARRCGYDCTTDISHEREWLVRVLTHEAERGLDQSYAFADARTAAQDT